MKTVKYFFHPLKKARKHPSLRSLLLRNQSGACGGGRTGWGECITALSSLTASGEEGASPTLQAGRAFQAASRGAVNIWARRSRTSSTWTGTECCTTTDLFVMSSCFSLASSYLSAKRSAISRRLFLMAGKTRLLGSTLMVKPANVVWVLGWDPVPVSRAAVFPPQFWHLPFLSTVVEVFKLFLFLVTQ